MNDTGIHVNKPVTPPPSYSGWCLLALMGNRVLAGQVSEARQFGATMIKLIIPATTHEEAFERFYAPAAIFSITPCSEETARVAALAANERKIPPFLR